MPAPPASTASSRSGRVPLVTPTSTMTPTPALAAAPITIAWRASSFHRASPSLCFRRAQKWALARCWTNLVAGATLYMRSRWARFCKDGHACHLTHCDSLLLPFAFSMYNKPPLTLSLVFSMYDTLDPGTWGQKQSDGCINDALLFC